MSALVFPPECCRCNARPGTESLRLFGSFASGATMTQVIAFAPLCRPCKSALDDDSAAWTRRFRRGCLIALTVAGLPFATLVACCRDMNFGDIGLVLLMLDGVTVLGSVLFFFFAGLWGRARIEGRTVLLTGPGTVRFGNAEYQDKFNKLNA